MICHPPNGGFWADAHGPHSHAFCLLCCETKTRRNRLSNVSRVESAIQGMCGTDGLGKLYYVMQSRSSNNRSRSVIRGVVIVATLGLMGLCSASNADPRAAAIERGHSSASRAGSAYPEVGPSWTSSSHYRQKTVLVIGPCGSHRHAHEPRWAKDLRKAQIYAIALQSKLGKVTGKARSAHIQIAQLAKCDYISAHRYPDRPTGFRIPVSQSNPSPRAPPR